MTQATDYHFTVDWFSNRIPAWETLFRQHTPTIRSALEIGSYEGRSACWMIENLPELRNLTCVDTWRGSTEHDQGKMTDVEAHFDRNVAIARARRETLYPKTLFRVEKVKDTSVSAISQALLTLETHPTQETIPFDFIYIDGSHEAPDVLSDLVGVYPILRTGGILIVDDYLWEIDSNPRRNPKLAVDAFLSVFGDKIKLFIGLPLYQVYAIKVA